MHRATASLATVTMLLSFAVPAQARPYTPRDAVALVALSEPQISSTGDRIAFLSTHMDYDRNRSTSDLVLYDVARGTTTVVRHDVAGIQTPQWSPDGSRLAYVRDVGDAPNTRPQIVIDTLGADDASPATKAPQAVDQFAWRPDGNAIAYTSPDQLGPGHRPGEAFEAGNGGYLDRAAPLPEHVYLVDLATAQTRRLTSASWSVAAQPISWTANAREIIFTRVATPYGSDSYRSVIAAVDPATGAVRTLTGHRRAEGTPAVSPDGAKLAYLYQRDGDPAAEQVLYVTTPAGGEGRALTGAALDVNVLGARWLPGSGALLIGANTGPEQALWLQPLAGRARRLQLGTVEPNLPSGLQATVARNGAIAFLGGDPRDGLEIYYLRSADARPVAITTYNRAEGDLQIGAVRAIAWHNDGFAEDGIVTLPPGYDARRAYPLVLRIHGGPNEASTYQLSSLNQSLAGAGWIVFSPNYRGSDNHGGRYLHAIVNDAVAGPSRDIMAGVAAVERRYRIDRTRVAVSGWSYGGLLTSWLITHERGWRAAVSGAAPNNLAEQYALSNLQWRFQFGGRSPWPGALATYAAQSPLTYASHATTPTLIMTDLRDGSVAMSSSYEMYRALRDGGVETQLWVYPLAGHMPSDPVHIVDYYTRWISWIRTHFAPRRGPGSLHPTPARAVTES
jgi:dipeptidyl aminopeptidase/acylaminoacyl peptidase